jgi:streptomycin 6-kinase
VRLPTGLEHWRSRPGGADWLGRLPALVAELATRWHLVLEPPFEPASIALVVPCTTEDGSRAVLKISAPDHDSAHEAETLLAWQSDVAVRVLEFDLGHGALLLERCVPGDRLWSVDDDAEATAIAARLLRELLRAPPPVHPFRRLGDVARVWAAEIPAAWERAGAPYDRGLLDEALAALDLVLQGAVDEVVVSQDFHGGNVLRAARGWVAIDPKPLIGDPAFAGVSLIRDRRWLLGDPGADRARLRTRLDVLEEEAGFDRVRLRQWGLVHALAWAIDGGVPDLAMVASARVLAALD